MRTRIEDGLSKCTDLIQSSSLRSSLNEMKTALNSEMVSAVRTAVRRLGADRAAPAEALKARVDESLQAVAHIADSFEGIRGEIHEGREQTARLMGIVEGQMTAAAASGPAPIDAAGRVPARTPTGTRLPARQRRPPAGAAGSPRRGDGAAAGGAPDRRRAAAPSRVRRRGEVDARGAGAGARDGDDDGHGDEDDEDEDDEEIVERFVRASKYSRSEKRLEKLYDELDQLDVG